MVNVMGNLNTCARLGCGDRVLAMKTRHHEYLRIEAVWFIPKSL
jgi:hypothetical protein